MADNFIAIDLAGGKRLAFKLREVVDQMEKYADMLETLKADMDQMIGAGPTYATLEAEFGLPTAKGATVYNLVAGTVSEFAADTNFVQLRSWLAAAW